MKPTARIVARPRPLQPRPGNLSDVLPGAPRSMVIAVIITRGKVRALLHIVACPIELGALDRTVLGNFIPRLICSGHRRALLPLSFRWRRDIKRMFFEATDTGLWGRDLGYGRLTAGIPRPEAEVLSNNSVDRLQQFARTGRTRASQPGWIASNQGPRSADAEAQAGRQPWTERRRVAWMSRHLLRP
jgi:hypothetical protein